MKRKREFQMIVLIFDGGVCGDEDESENVGMDRDNDRVREKSGNFWSNLSLCMMRRVG